MAILKDGIIIMYNLNNQVAKTDLCGQWVSMCYMSLRLESDLEKCFEKEIISRIKQEIDNSLVCIADRSRTRRFE